MPINKIPQRAFSNDDMIVDNYTATAGQTAFTLTRAAAVNSLLVHVNDVIQQPTVDYTVAGTTLTFTSALSVNDDVRVRVMTERPLGTQSGGSGATTLGALNDVSSAAPATGQVLKWSGTQWAPDTDATGGSGGGGAFTSTTDGASLTSTTAGSAAGPEVELHRDITGADGNYIGQLKFTADNDADQKNVFAKITGKIGDASDGTEDGVMEFAVKKAGSNNINVRMTSTKFRLINGTELEVAGMTYPSTDGTSGQFLRTDGAGNLSFASIGSGGSGGIALTDLSVASEGTASGDGSIAYNNSNGQFTYTPPTLDGLTNAGDVDFGSNKILYANVFANLSDLPSASSYHGMFAHVHGTGKAYYAHAGNWVPLADESQLTLDGLTGVSTSGVTSGQVLKYNGTSWAPAADSAGSGGIALGDISVGAEGTASGDGSLAYNNSTGVFTYTPPVIPAVALPDDQEFGVTASGASAYTFTGAATGNNPTLNLQKGKTYRFDVNASGHPFQIRVSSGGSNYTNGVVNAGTENGAVYFTVPEDAPNSLVYQCTNHAAMVGTINCVGKALGTPHVANHQLHVYKSATNEARIGNTDGGHTFISQTNNNSTAFEIYDMHGSNTTRNAFNVATNLSGGSKTNLLTVREDGFVNLYNGQGLNNNDATIQTITATPNTHASANPVNTWAEIHSSYRVSITPKYTDSHIYATYHIPMNPTGSTNILMAIAPWVSTNGGTTQSRLAQGQSPGSRFNLVASWFRSNNGFDSNDMQNHVVHFRHDHSTTSTLTYGFHFRSEGSNTTYFCHSSGNNGTWGWVAPIYMELREVR